MNFIDFIVNLLKDPRGQIAAWIVALGPVWVYTPLFLIVFIETGLVFFPFLPGDSLLFAAGVFSAPGGGLNIWATLIVFYAAAILGNTSNYWIARFFGSRIIDSGKVKALTPERMAKLDSFFERFGGLTIVITRFMPFFRTFAPFIAGTGHMHFGKFTFFNAIGGISWVSLFVLAGYFFGGVPFVQKHFEIIVLGIVGVSVLPALIGAVKGALAARKGAAKGAESAGAEADGAEAAAEGAEAAGDAAAAADASGAADAVDADEGAAGEGAAAAKADAPAGARALGSDSGVDADASDSDAEAASAVSNAEASGIGAIDAAGAGEAPRSFPTSAQMRAAGTFDEAKLSRARHGKKEE